MKPRQPPRVHAGTVPIPDRCGRRLQMTSATDRPAEVFFMGATKLEVQGVRRPTTRSTRATSASGASARSRSATTTRRLTDRRRRAAPADPGRPAEHLALRRLPAGRGGQPGPSGRASSRAGLPAGLHAADARRPPRRAPRPRRGVGQERRRQPDALVQGPRRRGRRRPRAGARLRHARLRLDRATSPTRSPRTPPRSGWRPTSSSRPTSRSRRSSRPGVYGTNAREGPRQLRRRQPAVHRALGRARLGVRQRQPAPVLRRGLQDARLRDRRAARLGDAGPRSSRRSPRARCSRRSPRASTSGSSSGWSTGDVPVMNGAQAAGLLAGRAGVRRRRTTSAGPVKPRHDRQVAGDREPGRRPVRARARAQQRRLDRGGHRRRDPRRASACWPRRPASSPRPPAASRRRCWPSSPRGATIGRDERVVLVITGEGLKTLDAVRGTFEAFEIDASLDAFESRRRAGGAWPR